MIRWKVACINWTHPDAPHALAYAWDGHEIRAERYFPTWPDALAWANHMAPRTNRRNSR